LSDARRVPKLGTMRLSFTLRGLRRVRSRLSADSGFSLTEALVVLLILGIVLSGLTTIFVSASRAELDANRRFRGQEQARLGLDQLRRELHCASGVTDINGAALSTSSSYSAVRISFGSYCTTTTPTAVATWCTLGAGPWALYRIDHAVASCSTGTGSRKVADFLIGQLPFSKPAAPSGVGTQLPRLRVSLVLNVKGTGATSGTSTLVDDIALRNAPRA
jgi:prepilin-type N-terminal cleavage/methylation domain-containing protein